MDRGNVSWIGGWIAMVACATNVARAQDHSKSPNPPTKRFPNLEQSPPQNAGTAVNSAPAVATEQQPAPIAHAPVAYASLAYSPPAREDSFDDAPMKRDWYGWQTLTTDGVAVGLYLFGTAQALSGAGAGALLGSVPTYFLGAPIVHLAHARPLVALGTFGLRVATVTTGYLIADSSKDCRGYDRDLGGLCGWGEIWLGLLIGAGTAITLDAALLAYENVGRAPRERSYEAQRLHLTPSIAVTRERQALLVSGNF
jgi:hypothetical protein